MSRGGNERPCVRFDSLGFETRYTVDPEAELPPAVEPVWFHPPEGRPSSDGVVIRVTPKRTPPWVGAFPSGAASLSGVFGTPRPDSILVVGGGTGYLVPTAEPRRFEIIGAVGAITEVHAAPDRGVLLLVSYTEVQAYSAEGLRWESARLAYDGIEITGIAAGWARGRAWCAPTQEWLPFALDLETGRHEGGAWPG